LRLGLLRCLLFAHGDHHYERVPEAGFRLRLAVVNEYCDWRSLARCEKWSNVTAEPEKDCCITPLWRFALTACL
jgi:hypothetical protein